MKTNQRIGTDLSALALKAATELDNRFDHSNAGASSTIALAQELRRIFPGEQRPQLPPETTGLVCGVVETWAADVPEEIS